jgi:hypothetical protein
LRAKALADAQFDWDREAERYVAAYARLAASARTKGLAGA